MNRSEKLEKAGTVDFKKQPARKVGTRSPGKVDPRFVAGLAFPVLKILEFVAFRDSGTFCQQFPGTFLSVGVLVANPRTDHGNSHSLLEF